MNNLQLAMIYILLLATDAFSRFIHQNGEAVSWLDPGQNRYVDVMMNTQTGHKIRHARSKAYENMEGSIACPAKASFDPAITQCPSPSCRNHGDCWSKHGASRACVCDPHLCGVVCVVEDRRCSFLQNPMHGIVTYKSRLVGAVAEYTCDSGYNVKGSAQRFCLATFQWSGFAPECKNQTDLCPAPPYIPNAEVAYQEDRIDYKNGDQVKIVCKKGFRDAISHVTARCYGNKWHYGILNCTAIECGKLGNPKSGSTMYPNGHRFQSKAVQFCNDAYRITCSDNKPGKQTNFCERYCMEDGQWSGKDPECKPILCPVLSTPKNGRLNQHWNTVNSLVTFNCNPGHELAGSQFRKCQSNGEWDGVAAICNVRDCGPPPIVHLSEALYTDTTYGSRVTYRCDRGTTPAGESSVLTCGETGNQSMWLPRPPPQCLRDCKAIRVEYGHVSLNDPSDPRKLEMNMRIRHALTLNVTCMAGHQLESDILPTCLNGTWSVIPKCVPAPCLKRPSFLVRGIARFYSRKHNSTAKYSCYNGYTLKIKVDTRSDPTQPWDGTIRCSFGQWLGPTPTCEPTRCTRPNPPTNGMMNIVGVNVKWPFTSPENQPGHNDLLQYECEAHHRLIGPQYAVCLAGQWSPSEQPVCRPVMHDHDDLPISWIFFPSGTSSDTRRRK